MTDLDPRVPTFRWAALDRYRKAHVWLGAATACGLAMRWTLQTWKPEADQMCPTCRGYVQGWLDRHDHGNNPQPGQGVPVPLAHNTKTELPQEATR
ncbi:hypothetical protein ACFRFU_19445 [Streptomyces sp. NPDC056704]|uniref:hypothetical protein n=1 Tax=Streptomyces sp. NPDC056704 TaxID=3345917 RepID=UPI0036BB3A1D